MACLGTMEGEAPHSVKPLRVTVSAAQIVAFSQLNVPNV